MSCALLPRRGATHVAGECDGCGVELPPRARRWCRPDCRGLMTWLRNHYWTTARWFAIRRAGGHEWTCDHCGRRPAHESPEVNHVEPRVGKGYGAGCHHHQTNLQVLCHDCHVAETTRQIRERRGIPPEGRQGVRLPPGPEPALPLWADA